MLRASLRTVSLFVSIVGINLNASAIRGILNRPAIPILLVLVLIGAYRLALTPTGQEYFPDEARYYTSERMLDALKKGDSHEAIVQLFDAQARPGAVLIGLVPAQIQRWLSAGYSTVSVFNALVSLTIVLLVYRIMVLFLPNRLYAAGGASLYALIHSTSLYIRHLLPYDWALAVFMLAVWLILRAQTGGRRWWLASAVCGLLCGIGFSIYPGYYPLVAMLVILVALPGMAALWHDKRIGMVQIRQIILPLLAFAVGFAAVMLILEIIARSAGLSYLGSTSSLAGTINEGEYWEGYIFGVSRLGSSEGPYGWLLMALFVVSLFLTIRRRDVDLRIRAAVVLSLLAYLAYGTLSVVFHTMVFYGRLLHMYLPFLAMGAALTLASLPRFRRAAWPVALVTGVLCFAWNASLYLPLKYPKDVRAALFADYPGLKVCELITNVNWDINAFGACDVVGVNVRFLWPGWNTTMVFQPPSNWQPLYTTLHPADYVPYQFEGYRPQERVGLALHPHILGIYRIIR